MNTIQKPTSGGIIGGLILITLGVLFLLGNFIRADFMGALWPLFVIAFGALFFVGMVVLGKSAGGLAIPGSMFVMLGLILVAQSLFDKFESWAYAWTLFAVAGVGIGLVIFSWWSEKPNLKRPGYTLIALGLVLFLVFGAFFEMLFSFGGFSGMWLPLVLIGLGIVLLFGRLLNWEQLIAKLPPHNELKG